MFARFYVASLVIMLLSVGNVFSQVNFSDSVDVKMHIAKDLDSVWSEVSNTGAKLLLPKFFEPFSQGNYNGFIHQGTSCTIIGQTLLGQAYPTIVAAMSAEVFAKQNATLLKSFEVKTLDGNPAHVYLVSFYVENIKIHRVLFLTGDYQNTIMLTGNYAELFAPLMFDVMLSSFMTIKI